jgi:hypothetical protein
MVFYQQMKLNMILLKIILIVVYILINMALAKYDAYKIATNKKIKHGINALVYVILILPTFNFTKSWVYLIGLLALRRIVFDTALNLYRGLKHDYISATTTSIIDRLSYDIQAKYGYLYYYGVFAIIVIISIFL